MEPDTENTAPATGIREKSQQESEQTNAWQKRLLPWLIMMPTLLIILFVYLATRQMQRFNTKIDEKSESAIDKLVPSPSDTALYNKLKGDMRYIQWITLARMEEKSFDRRYSQGALLLVSRVFTKYLGFFTGMILAIVGSVFIIGKLQEEKTDMEGGMGENIKMKMASSSPGIIFAVLGTILMLSTILQHTDISITDQPMFLTGRNIYINSALNDSPSDSLANRKAGIIVNADSINDIWNKTK